MPSVCIHFRKTVHEQLVIARDMRMLWPWSCKHECRQIHDLFLYLDFCMHMNCRKKCKRELQLYEYWIIISHYFTAQMVASVATRTVGKTVCLSFLNETQMRFLPLFMTASSALLKKEKHQLFFSSPCSRLHNGNGSLTVRPTRGS